MGATSEGRDKRGPTCEGKAGERKREGKWREGEAERGIAPMFARIRPSIQTGLAFGGTGLCTYRVRGVDGSCAEHLTVESYTVFICQQSYLLLLGIP